MTITFLYSDFSINIVRLERGGRYVAYHCRGRKWFHCKTEHFSCLKLHVIALKCPPVNCRIDFFPMCETYQYDGFSCKQICVHNFACSVSISPCRPAGVFPLNWLLFGLCVGMGNPCLIPIHNAVQQCFTLDIVSAKKFQSMIIMLGFSLLAHHFWHTMCSNFS